MIHGCDISFWQDADTTPQKVDFARMKAAGASFVIIRVGQGAWKDEDFADYYRDAKAAGLPRGLYWFYDSRYSPATQAALCLSLIGTEYPELGVWADFEDTYNGEYKGYQNWKIFLSLLRAKTPKVGVYTGPYYWMSNRPTSETYLTFFSSFPLWIAHYGVSTPLVPSPWKSWVFWQYTSSGDGLKYGAESKEIDVNWFNGDASYLQSLFDLTETLPTPDTEPTGGETMATYKGVCVYEGAKVWDVPGGTQVGRLLKKGEAVSVDDRKSYGATMYDHLTAPVVGWTKSMWLSVSPIVEPPPVTPPPPAVVKVPFTLAVDGYKPYSGELEKA